MKEKVLTLNNPRKVFGDIVALEDISFNVGKGEIVGLLAGSGG